LVLGFAARAPVGGNGMGVAVGLDVGFDAGAAAAAAVALGEADGGEVEAAGVGLATVTLVAAG
jgi:hypothetical protein